MYEHFNQAWNIGHGLVYKAGNMEQIACRTVRRKLQVLNTKTFMVLRK